MSQTKIRLPPKWIELNIKKTECCVFLAASDDSKVCQCGKDKSGHDGVALYNAGGANTWSPRNHTKSLNTDAYGTIVFEGEGYPNKAHYVRLSQDTNPELIVQLMRYVWNVELPQLVISVRGGTTNFDMSSRLAKIFQNGIIKAARTTNAWILSDGLNEGVVKHLGSALSNEKKIAGLKHGRICAVGITSWGLVENREELLGRNKEAVYNNWDSTTSHGKLNSKHSNFLLVDNGNVGKASGENYLRGRLEKCIASYPIGANKRCGTPVVVIVVEGGFNTLRQICDYLYDEPPVPVVIFSGTGNAADLISFVLRKATTEDDLDNRLKENIVRKINQYFDVNSAQSKILYRELKKIYRRRNLITLYHPTVNNENSFDTAILSAVFKLPNWSPLQQLSLSIVWDRVDIALSQVFLYGREWPRDHLEHAMMEALASNRIDFVGLLLEHGINMQSFLTAHRLEGLYSLDKIQHKVLRAFLVEMAGVKETKADGSGYGTFLTLHDIGIALSHMIGHVYQSPYVNLVTKIPKSEGGEYDDHEVKEQTFQQPFDDLFLWAILTKRHEMSKLLWQHGKGALAKALIAVKLNKYIAREIHTAEKTITSNVAVIFENYADEWERISLSLLDSCYRSHSKLARQLLTMELESWPKQTCLTLAVLSNHRSLLAHSCCQVLLADLWMGGLNIQANSYVIILLAILFPPLALCCSFKTYEEMRLLPHKDKSVYFGPANAQSSFSQIHTEVCNDPENCINPQSSFIKSYNTKQQERTTDLAIVARSIFPVQKQQPEVDTIDENSQETLQDSNSKQQIQAEEKEYFKFKLRNRDETQKDGCKPKYRTSFVTTQHQLSCWRKFIEFQIAPVTNYTRHAIAYVVFIIAYVYMIMYKQDPKVLGYVEICVMCYIAAQFMESIRELFQMQIANFTEMFAGMKQNVWQLGDFVIAAVCIAAGALRLCGYFEYAMLIYRTSSIYWNFRLYKYLSMHRFIGPKITMMRRMMGLMTHFALIIVVVIIAFGILQKAIRHPNSNPTPREFAEAFLEPYRMMFGEVDNLDALTFYCHANTSAATIQNCPPGHWVIPIAWIVYMIVSNILIINVLIAAFNGIYEEVDAVAAELWMFHRYNSVMEFETKPVLPPPFVVICHFIAVMKFLYEMFLRCICEEELLLEMELEDDNQPRIILGGNDHSLKSFLSEEEQSMVFGFEEENVFSIASMLTRDLNVQRHFNYIQIYSSKQNRKDSFEDNRLASGSDKHAAQQLKLVLGDLHSEIETQRGKLDEMLNWWNSDTLHNSNLSMPKSKGENSFEKDFYDDVTNIGHDDGKTISTTSSLDEFQ